MSVVTTRRSVAGRRLFPGPDRRCVGAPGCQWRYVPDRFPPWLAVWKQWCRRRANGVWARAMARLVSLVRRRHDERGDQRSKWIYP
jgi:transposase